MSKISTLFVSFKVHGLTAKELNLTMSRSQKGQMSREVLKYEGAIVQAWTVY